MHKIPLRIIVSLLIGIEHIYLKCFGDDATYTVELQ